MCCDSKISFRGVNINNNSVTLCFIAYFTSVHSILVVGLFKQIHLEYTRGANIYESSYSDCSDLLLAMVSQT